MSHVMVWDSILPFKNIILFQIIIFLWNTINQWHCWKAALDVALLLLYFSLKNRNSDTADHLLNPPVLSWLLNKLSPPKAIKNFSRRAINWVVLVKFISESKQYGEELYWDYVCGHSTIEKDSD